MKNYLVVFLFSFLACQSTQNKDHALVRSDSLKIDSLKWLMYALNNYGKLEAVDSFSNRVILEPIQCEVRLINKYVSGDTIACTFAFYKNGFRGISPSQALPVRAIGIYGGKYALDFYHVIPDFTKYPDSVRNYILIADSTFREYIKTFDGEISFWLKEEARGRGILQ